MASEDASGSDHTETTGDGTTGDRLVRLYERYLGEPGSRQDVYIGFGLFFAGIAMGAVGLFTLVYTGTLATGSEIFWQFREVALVTAMLGLPAVALSIVVLLPVGRRTLAMSLLGAGICLAATAWLTVVYPFEWTEAGNDITVISTYAAGIVVLAASTGSALVAEYLDRTTGRQRSVTEPTQDTSTADRETVTDEEVEEDIEEVMDDSSLTWGGVSQQPTTKRLELDLPATDEDIDQSEFEQMAATETRAASDDVDNAVNGLRQLQGEEKETARAESPDEQVTALTEFREQHEDNIQTGVDTEESLLDRVRSRLSWDRDR